MEYICPICNKKFQSYRKRTTCSKKCLSLYQQNREIIACDFCGKQFSKRKSMLRKHNFCSRRCTSRFQSQNRIKFPKLRDKNWLEKEYLKKPMSQIAKEIGCSEVVINKYFHLHGLIVRKDRHLSGIKKTKSHCSNLSKSKIDHQTNVGSKNPNWRGGISSLAKRIRSLAQYSQWRDNVLKANINKCVFCESTENLEVDHIKQLRFIIADNHINSIKDAKNCNELWDPSNGRILCKECNLQREFI